MRPQLQALAIFGFLALCATPARAQLSAYVADNGNLVYTNDMTPVRPATTTRVPATAAFASTAPEPAAREASLAPAPAPPLSGGQRPFAAQPLMRVAPPPPEVLNQIVEKTAQKNNMDPALVRAVISTESNWNASAISSRGAQGLMQLIPGTAQQMGVGNPLDPAQNVDGGVRYLHMLLERYNGDLPKALAAYNAGPGAVDRFGGVPNYRETRDYVHKVTSNYWGPGAGGMPPGLRGGRRIYRATDDQGHIVFTNE